MLVVEVVRLQELDVLVDVVGDHRLAEVFALDRVLGAHQGEHRVRVLDHADAGAAVELLERVVLGVFGRRGGVGSRHAGLPGITDAGVRYEATTAPIAPDAGRAIAPAGSVRAAEKPLRGALNVVSARERGSGLVRVC